MGNEAQCDPKTQKLELHGLAQETCLGQWGRHTLSVWLAMTQMGSVSWELPLTQSTKAGMKAQPVLTRIGP